MGSLWDLSPEQSATIEQFTKSISAPYLQRLLAFGFLRGNKIECLRWTPFNGPRVFQVGDSIVTLDSQVGKYIKVSSHES